MPERHRPEGDYHPSTSTPGGTTSEQVVGPLARRGWTATLPADAAELRANAQTMGNCASSYDDHIRGGAALIVIVEHASDPVERYNVGLQRQARRGIVTEVKGRYNSACPHPGSPPRSSTP